MSILSYTSINVVLSLEKYYNQGITPEEAKQIIESKRNGYYNYLYAQHSGVNNNWMFEVKSSEEIPYLLVSIECDLMYLLHKKKGETNAKNN